ncbi:profilin-1-like [Liolophura sinensis]|uniref:profilin-1-like n=1 Tax=Liolophura sinensis TaxID=3198878 RepID=UPI0031582D23
MSHKHCYEQTKASHVNSRRLEKPAEWSEYIYKVLLNSGFVTMAAIHGIADGREWAASSGFSVTPEEAKYIINGFTEPRELRRYGILLGGIVYTCTTVRPKYILGRRGSSGCVIYMCKQSIIIAVYGGDVLPGGCLNIVLKLGDYLEDNGL